MIDRYGIEFSKVYGRLMRLELLIKEKAFLAIINCYGANSFEVFADFFTGLFSSKKYPGEKKNLINNNEINDNEKFKALVKCLYLPDLLNLILKHPKFKTSEITDNFYVQLPVNFNQLKKQRIWLRELRNDIAHYNFSSYAQNKIAYWNALLLFEKHLGHNILGIESLPVLGLKPSVRKILQSIANLRPDLLDINLKEENQMIHHYNKQRLLLDIFDEIALYNGYDSTELHSPWSIFREAFRFKKENNEPLPPNSTLELAGLDLIFE